LLALLQLALLLIALLQLMQLLFERCAGRTL